MLVEKFQARHGDTGLDDFDDGVDRAAQIEQIRSGKLDITTCRGSDETIRLHGKMGIVAGRFEAKGMYEGLPFDAVKRYTSVWVIRDGRWLCVHSHVSLLPSQSEAVHGRA